MDFYVTECDSLNNWLKPINVGKPLNTKGEDSFMSISASMNVIYFSKQGIDSAGKGSLDIYKLVLPASTLK